MPSDATVISSRCASDGSSGMIAVGRRRRSVVARLGEREATHIGDVAPRPGACSRCSAPAYRRRSPGRAGARARGEHVLCSSTRRRGHGSPSARPTAPLRTRRAPNSRAECCAGRAGRLSWGQWPLSARRAGDGTGGPRDRSIARELGARGRSLRREQPARAVAGPHVHRLIKRCGGRGQRASASTSSSSDGSRYSDPVRVQRVQRRLRARRVAAVRKLCSGMPERGVAGPLLQSRRFSCLTRDAPGSQRHLRSSPHRRVRRRSRTARGAGVDSLDQLIDRTVPPAIRMTRPLQFGRR
jgi:hypothetical protein